MSIFFKPILPEELAVYFPQVSARLQKALNAAGGRYGLEDIEKDLKFGHLQLVVGIDEEGNILGEAVYRKVIYPKKKALLLLLASAVSFRDFFEPLYEYSFHLLKAIDFDILETLCRPAIARRLMRKGHTTNYWITAHGRR